jgi:ankyrin repeat protein
MQSIPFSGFLPKPRHDNPHSQARPAIPPSPLVHARTMAPLLAEAASAGTPRRDRNPEPGAGDGRSACAASGSAPRLQGEENDNPEGLPPLILAARKGDLRALTALLAKPETDIEQVDYKYGMSAIMHAVQQNHVLLVSALLDAGAAVHRSEQVTGHTPLIIAAAAGHVHIVTLLLKQHGIETDRTDRCGYSALMRAATKNRPDVVACLLQAGAAVNLADSRNQSTALMLAMERGHRDVVRLLLMQPGIELDRIDRHGRSALICAAIGKLPEAAASLLAAGASTSVVDHRGQSAVAHALAGRAPAVLEVLLGYPAGTAEEETELDYLPGQDACFAAIADLYAASSCALPALLELGRDIDFFQKLSGTHCTDGHDTCALRWMHRQGIRIACALQVDAALRREQVRWQAQQASAQQRLMSLLGAISSLPASGRSARMLDLYRDAGISPAGVNGLGSVAVAQLADLARRAAEMLASMGGEMAHALVDICLTMTGPDGQAAQDALRARLFADGYCAPCAEVIAASWQTAYTAFQKQPASAFTAFQKQPVSLTNGAAAAQPASAPQTPASERAVILFARELHRQLGARERLAGLQPALGDDDAALQAQFRIQGGQLRRYCERLLQTPLSIAAPQQ